MYGEQLLSRVLDEKSPALLRKYGIERDHFKTEVEQRVYDLIIETNCGIDGPFAEGEVNGFTYIPYVESDPKYLARKIKDEAGKREMEKFMASDKTQKMFDNESSENFANYLQEAFKQIKLRTSVRESVGVSLKNDTAQFKAEYDRRKAGESFRVWQSRFPTINREIGGYTSGNVYAWYGRSGRGKSVMTTEEAVEAALEGATVLFWSMEMPRYEVLARMYTSLSAREGVVLARIDGIEQEVGFLNRDIRMGTLSDEFKAGLDAFLDSLADVLPGDIILRAVDDEDFDRRRCGDLEQDIELTDADVVVIDPIYYMDFEVNTSKTAGGDVAATSKALRRLAGSKSVVIHVITQADEVADESGEDGERELRPPTRKELSKSKAILQDAALTIGIDTLATQGIIQLNKGRDGGEGTQIEITYMPNYGIVREIELGASAAAQFKDVF